MKIPEDKHLSITQFQFSDGPIEVGRWKDQESRMIQTVFRKQGGQWHFGNQGSGTADFLFRIHYIDKKSTVDQAWEKLKGFLTT